MAVEKVTATIALLLTPRHQGAAARDLPPPSVWGHPSMCACAGSVHLTLTGELEGRHAVPHSSDGEIDTQLSCTNHTNLPRRETCPSPARLHRPLCHTNHGAEQNTHASSKYSLRAYCAPGMVPGTRTEDTGIRPWTGQRRSLSLGSWCSVRGDWPKTDNARLRSFQEVIQV